MRILHVISNLLRTGMSSGNWHRLDNIFAILSAQTMFIHFADFQTQEVNELVRWICLFITLFFQVTTTSISIQCIHGLLGTRSLGRNAHDYSDRFVNPADAR